MPGRRVDVYEEPLTNCMFRVEIDGIAIASFQGVDGLNVQQDMVEYRDGDDPVMRKRPGLVKWGDITLKHGYSADTTLQDWVSSTFMGYGTAHYERVNLSIVAMDHNWNEVIRWNCYECYPKSWKLSSFDGKGNDLLVEELVVTIERAERG